MSTLSLKAWMKETRPDTGVPELLVLRERDGQRALVQPAIQETVKDHLAGLDILNKIGGYAKTLAYIRNKMPSAKRVRSGDFAEILATEYIDQCTEYRVPIKRLRWKDDRNTTMRGDDVIGIQREGQRWKVLKAESKSRAALSETVVGEAVDGLQKNGGRPNPSSLAFISSRLREMDRDAEATVFERLQSRPPRTGDIEHLVFSLSGNDPMRHLKQYRADGSSAIRRHLVGCIIPDHQDFITTVFENIHAGIHCRNHPEA
ncbi:MAG: Hachiman antiphage defense system protein HamA [Gemmataceae bacterium]